MLSFLGLLPLAACGSLIFLLGNRWPEWGWGKAFVRGVILAGAYLVLVTEALGLVHAIALLPLVVLWSIPVGLGVGYVIRERASGNTVRWPKSGFPRSWWTRGQLMMIGVAFIATGLVAWFAPPQTWDSLSYHMARVAHWAQNMSLNHYATGINRQNFMSPGAEIEFLNFYVLAQGDSLANLAQWLAMAASVMGAAIVAGQLGARKAGQAFAGVFVATVPIGIAEASSTMTDYVAAMWLIFVVFETVEFLKREEGRDSYVFLGLSAGLAILAKPVAFPYLAPMVVLILVAGFMRRRRREFAIGCLIVLGMVLAVNLGYVARNEITYGNPLGPTSQLGRHTNPPLNVRVVVSNVLRNASLQAGTPWPAVNREIFRAIVGVHFKMGIDPNDPSTSTHGDFAVYSPTQSETRANGLLHAVLVLVALIGLSGLAIGRWNRYRWALLYVWMAVFGFVIFSMAFKFSTFGSRYELPFFVVVSPVVAWLIDRPGKPAFTAALALGLTLYAWPWLVDINQRPLLPDENGLSVVTEPRIDQYFINAPGLEQPYQQASAAIKAASCDAVGLMLGGDAAEYPLWVTMGEPGSKVKMEWIVSGVPSARYRDPAFSPCAVVCDVSCPGGVATKSGLPLAMNEGGIRLFISK